MIELLKLRRAWSFSVSLCLPLITVPVSPSRFWGVFQCWLIGTSAWVNVFRIELWILSRRDRSSLIWGAYFSRRERALQILKRSTAPIKWILTGRWRWPVGRLQVPHPGCNDLRRGDLELELLSNRGDQIVSERFRVVYSLWNSIKQKIGTWVCASDLPTLYGEKISLTCFPN